MSDCTPKEAWECLAALAEKNGGGWPSAVKGLWPLAFPDEYLAQVEDSKRYCPHCLNWAGGPLLCCEKYGDPNTLTKAEADEKRAERKRQQGEA